MESVGLQFGSFHGTDVRSLTNDATRADFDGGGSEETRELFLGGNPKLVRAIIEQKRIPQDSKLIQLSDNLAYAIATAHKDSEVSIFLTFLLSSFFLKSCLIGFFSR